MKELLRLLPYVKPYRKWIIAGGVCLLLATPCQLFHPLVWKFIVDTVILEHQHQWLLPALLVMLAVHLAGAGLSGLRAYLLGVAGHDFIFELRNTLYKKLQYQSLSFFHDHRSGDLISCTMADVDVLQHLVIEGIDNIFGSALSFIFVAGIIIALHPVVGAVTLVPILFVAFLIYKFNIRIRRLYRGIRDKRAAVAAKLQENIAGMTTIKAFARDGYEIDRFRAENRVYRDAGVKGVKARAIYFPGIMTLGFVSNFIMIGLGGWFVINGSFSLGGLVAYRGYWWQLFAPIQTLGRINDMYQRAIAAASRIFELLDEPDGIPDKMDAHTLPHVEGRIQFTQVTFAYNEHVPALRDINFHIEPGETIGIAGPSGGGKSTLLNLLLRFYDPTSGSILLEGHNIATIRKQALRSHIGIVSQDPFLFHMTVGENVRYGKLDATDAQLAAALQQANATEFVEALPQKLDTIVGERGVKLSGGQRQRLCIARAFLENPRVLLLDEATASVEAESEMQIQTALQRLMQGRTTIIVSHRLSMIRSADRIIVIDGGRISEEGNHESLMQAGDWYARMYRMQTTDARS